MYRWKVYKIICKSVYNNLQMLEQNYVKIIPQTLTLKSW